MHVAILSFVTYCLFRLEANKQVTKQFHATAAIEAAATVRFVLLHLCLHETMCISS